MNEIYSKIQNLKIIFISCIQSSIIVIVWCMVCAYSHFVYLYTQHSWIFDALFSGFGFDEEIERIVKIADFNYYYSLFIIHIIHTTGIEQDISTDYGL